MSEAASNTCGLPPASTIPGFVAPQFHELSAVVRSALGQMLTCDPQAGVLARIYLANCGKSPEMAAMELGGLLMLARLTLTDDACGRA